MTSQQDEFEVARLLLDGSLQREISKGMEGLQLVLKSLRLKSLQENIRSPSTSLLLRSTGSARGECPLLFLFHS